MLKIDKTITDENTTIILEGRLDTVTSRDLEATLKDLLPGTTNLIFDFTKLDYVSSAGLRVLLSAHKTMLKQGEMKLIHVSPEIMDIFEVTGFSDILTIE